MASSGSSHSLPHLRPPHHSPLSSSPPPPSSSSSSRALIPFSPIFIPPSSSSAAADKSPPPAPADDDTPDDSDANKVELSGGGGGGGSGGGREHKKRSKNWSRSETLALIRLRRDLAHRFAKSGRKSELWDEIAETLRRNHFSRDAQQCRDKWEKLMAGYKDVRDGLKHPDDNPYYEELHPLLCHRHPKRERDSSHHHDIPPPNPPPPPPTLHVPKIQAVTASDVQHHPHPSLAQRPAAAAAAAPPPPPPVSNGLPQPSLRPSSAPEPRHRHRPSPLGKRGANLVYVDDDYDQDDDHAGVDEEDEEDEDDEEEQKRQQDRAWKRTRKSASKLGDFQAVQALLESIISRQQRFFEELLNDMEKKEEARELMRQQREEKWREEERAQRVMFTDAMRILTQTVLGAGEAKMEAHQKEEEEEQEEEAMARGMGAEAAMALPPQPKRRSKNWKRTEVLQLIRLRGEMEEKFVTSSRRAALWNELADTLATLGVKRDGKQCREKWDKLMAEYKEVVDGKKEKSDSSYFPELQAALSSGRPREAG